MKYYLSGLGIFVGRARSGRFNTLIAIGLRPLPGRLPPRPVFGWDRCVFDLHTRSMPLDVFRHCPSPQPWYDASIFAGRCLSE